MFGYADNELVGQSVKILMPVLNKMPHESVAATLLRTADDVRSRAAGRTTRPFRSTSLDTEPDVPAIHPLKIRHAIEAPPTNTGL